MTDATFDASSMYGSDRWCAQALGRNLGWFQRARKTLESDGFPPCDPIVGLTIKSDVQDWVAKRKRVSFASVARFGQDATPSKENLSAL